MTQLLYVHDYKMKVVLNCHLKNVDSPYDCVQS